VDLHVVSRAPPGPDDLAVEEDSTRPDTGGPELTPLSGIRDEQYAVLTLKQVIGVTAGE
jgi:hypothetical protein